MIEAATKSGNVIVILNSDEWLKRKKGYVFMPFEERKYLLQQIKGVHGVTNVNDIDGTVCEALRRIKPDLFGNGGHRTAENTPEVQLCEELGIDMAWELGGEKVQSSSGLINTVFKTRSAPTEIDQFKETLEKLFPTLF